MNHDDDVERPAGKEREAMLCQRRAGEPAREIIGATMHHAKEECGQVRRFGELTAADELSGPAEDLVHLVVLTPAPRTTR